jgi:hypothetical protein
VYLADNLTKLMVGEVQIALLSFNAKATGRTLTSVKGRVAPSTPTFQHRQVTAGYGYQYVDQGTGPAAGHSQGKYPLRYVGQGVRGGKLFDPVDNLKEWFVLRGIPQSLWFPIVRKIAQSGIKPRKVTERAVQWATPDIRSHITTAAARIANGLIKVG